MLNAAQAMKSKSSALINNVTLKHYAAAKKHANLVTMITKIVLSVS
jgi:hypothetical protein